jgi:hypothetical protein
MDTHFPNAIANVMAIAEQPLLGPDNPGNDHTFEACILDTRKPQSEFVGLIYCVHVFNAGFSCDGFGHMLTEPLPNSVSETTRQNN